MSETPCTVPAASQFDFWVGDWDLTWDGGYGANQIRKILGGCVIEERFNGRSHDENDPPFHGMSVSVYNEQLEQWQQTWVDNHGNYLDFVGGPVDDAMILQRETTTPQGEPLLQRMVFSQIEADSLEWSWERSKDGGQTWEPLWQIHYERQ
jgi:hypothetical protein